MHAGDGNETTRNNGDIWSIFYSQDSVITVAGGGFTERRCRTGTAESSGITSPLGVMCHEFGHELGLPDLFTIPRYPAGARSSERGNLWMRAPLTDSGPILRIWAPGINSILAGLRRLSFLLKAITLSPMLKTPNPYLSCPCRTGPPGMSCFLVEYRSQSSGAQFDQKIPGSGLLIWHCG